VGLLLGFGIAAVVGFLTAQLAIVVTTVWLHRGLAHKGLSVHGPAVAFFRTVIWTCTGMRPREWVAVHRRHHATSDTAEDPHSPIVLGFWKVQLGNAGLYRRVAKDQLNSQRYAKDLPADAWDRRLFDKAGLGLGVGITLLCVSFALVYGVWWGALLGFVASAAHLVSYLGLSGAVNAVGHTLGRRPYENLATNNQWLAFLTGGEGLHNNHHAAPTSARFSHRRGELDPGWWIVRTLERMRMASVRHDSPKLRKAA